MQKQYIIASDANDERQKGEMPPLGQFNVKTAPPP